MSGELNVGNILSGINRQESKTSIEMQEASLELSLNLKKA